MMQFSFYGFMLDVYDMAMDIGELLEKIHPFSDWPDLSLLSILLALLVTRVVWNLFPRRLQANFDDTESENDKK